MTLPPIYCDQDSSSAALIQQLRLAGVDVIAAREVGNMRLGDEQLLQYATSVGRAI